MQPTRWKVALLPLWLAVVVSFPGSLSAAPFAYITNIYDGTVSVLDTATDTVTATVPVGDAYGVAVTPDGAWVYLGGAVTVTVLDTATNAVLTTVPVGQGPQSLAVTPDGRRVYVANWGSNTVSVIERATNAVIATLNVWGQNPLGVAITPDGTRVYVSSFGHGAVFVIDTATHTVSSGVTVGFRAQGLAVTPDGRRVYVANWGSDTVSVISTVDNTVTTTIPVGREPEAVAITPDGTRVYVSNGYSGTVSVISTATNTVTAEVAVGRPRGIAVHPDGTRVYVATWSCNCVSVIDTATNTVTATVPVGAGPVAFGQFIGPDVRDRVGVFRPTDGTFYLDYLGNGAVEGCAADRCLSIGMNGDVPLVGDWNGSGTGKVGLFRPSAGEFYLDYDGSGTWSGCGVDRCLQFGMTGDIPVVGDWNGTGPSKVGTFRPSEGTFYLDYNGNGTWDGCGVDRCLPIGMTGDTPLIRNWTGSGTTKVGTFRPTDGAFYLDSNGNGVWDGCGVDRCQSIGLNGDIPLVGDWNGSGTAKVGTFRPSDGTFYLDYNGNGTWDGCGVDRCLPIGTDGDIPLVGKW